MTDQITAQRTAERTLSLRNGRQTVSYTLFSRSDAPGAFVMIDEAVFRALIAELETLRADTTPPIQEEA